MNNYNKKKRKTNETNEINFTYKNKKIRIHRIIKTINSDEYLKDTQKNDTYNDTCNDTDKKNGYESFCLNKEFNKKCNIKKNNNDIISSKLVSIDLNLKNILRKLDNIENKIKHLEKKIDICGSNSFEKFIELKELLISKKYNSENINFFDYAVI